MRFLRRMRWRTTFDVQVSNLSLLFFFFFSGCSYYKNLEWFVQQRAQSLPEDEGPPAKPNTQLPSDMALISDDGSRDIVLEFAQNEAAFFTAFTNAYRKLTDTGFSN